MTNYIDGFSKIIKDGEFITLTYYALGILIAMIILFLLARLLKNNINKKVRKIDVITMDLKDLEKMRRTGLISEDEYKKAKSKIVGILSAKLGAPGEAEKSEPAPPREKPSHAGKKFQEPKPPIKTQPAPVSAPKKKEKKKKPLVDIDDLLEKGLISKEEYNRLAEINRNKNI